MLVEKIHQKENRVDKLFFSLLLFNKDTYLHISASIESILLISTTLTLFLTLISLFSLHSVF